MIGKKYYFDSYKVSAGICNQIFNLWQLDLQPMNNFLDDVHEPRQRPLILTWTELAPLSVEFPAKL